MRLRTAAFVLVFLFLFADSGRAFESQSDHDSKQVTVEVVDGIFNNLDKDKQTISVFLDRDRKISYRLEFYKIRSVYLIQGQERKLAGLLKYAVAGGTIGLTSKIVIDMKNRNAETEGRKLDLIGAALWTVGSAGASALAGFFRDRGEEEPRTFPIYDPEIRMVVASGVNDNDGGSSVKVDYADIKRLELLTAGISFVRITLKDGSKVRGDDK